MRISDWSSDVCSSDLEAVHVTRLALGQGLVGTIAEDVDVLNLAELAIFDRRNLYDPAVVEEAGLAYYGIGRGRSLQVDRKSVVWGKSVSVRVDLGGRRIIKKKKIERRKQEDNQ